jgi:serine/threonine-protein kinase
MGDSREYQLLRSIGRGGMAEVWEARWRSPSGEPVAVALKQILPDLCRNATLTRMFLGEARLAKRLRHPNIVRALDAGRLDGRPFIALELVDGIDLRTLWRGSTSPLPVGASLYIARELCAALSYAHELTSAQGRCLSVVHRDVSPGNVMLASDGAVKLLDFGLAKALGELTAEATQRGIIKGKLGYLAPELLRAAPYDHRVDLFSLGVVLYELLAHQRLFDADSDFGVITLNQACNVAPPSTINRAIPPELDRIVLRAVTRDPEKRYASAREMAADLNRALQRTPFTRKQISSLVRSHRERTRPVTLPQELLCDSANESSYVGEQGLTAPAAGWRRGRVALGLGVCGLLVVVLLLRGSAATVAPGAIPLPLAIAPPSRAPSPAPPMVSPAAVVPNALPDATLRSRSDLATSPAPRKRHRRRNKGSASQRKLGPRTPPGA